MFELRSPRKKGKIWRALKKHVFIWGKKAVKHYPKRKKFKNKQLYVMPRYKADWKRAFKIRKLEVQQKILDVRKRIAERRAKAKPKKVENVITTEMRNRIYGFKHVWVATVLVSDAGFFTAVCNKDDSRASFSGAQSYPLPINEGFDVQKKQFAKLYDTDQFEQRVSSRAGTKRAGKVTRPTPKRFNAKFINRFATHGKTQRSSKNFAQAVSRIVMLSRLHAVPFTDVITDYESSINFFKLSGIVAINGCNLPKLSMLKYRARIRDNLRRGPAELGQMFGNMYTTNFMFNRLKELAPTYSATPRRVDKARYKNMRGKTGKYTLKVRRIPQNKSVVYGLIYLKFQWIFSEQSNYINRFTHILIALLFYPKGTLGYMVSRKIVKKILEK